MVQEETVVEGKACIVICERLALVWGSRDDNLSDAHIFTVGTYPRPPAPSMLCSCEKKKTRRHHLLFAR